MVLFFFKLLFLAFMLAPIQLHAEEATPLLKAPQLIFSPEDKSQRPTVLIFPKMGDQVSKAPIAISTPKKIKNTKRKKSKSK